MQVDRDLVYSVPDWRDTLRNFHPIENNRYKMALQPYPSLKVLTKFASLAYNDCTGELPLPEGWNLLTTARNNSWSNNYFGIAFWNPSEQQITIAHRGTNPGNVGALFADVKGIFFNKFTKHMSSAVSFAEEIKKIILETKVQPSSRFVLSFTGHSLGGWLAGVTTLTVKYLKGSGSEFFKTANSSEGIHAHTLALDSPGVEDILIKICNYYDVRYDRSMHTEKLDITTIFAAPNLVNTTGFHTGEIFQVLIDSVAPSSSEKPTVLFNLDTHRMDVFIQAFEDENYIDNKYIVKNWPQGWSQHQNYHDLEMLSNSHFLQPANEQIPLASSSGSHQNPQSVEGNSDSMYSEETTTLQYSTILSRENTCRLGVFSAEELSFLENLRIFQTNAIKLTEIEQFITTHNLDRFIFPLFKVDTIKNTIGCKSREDLTQVIRQTKQLLRWFPEEIKETLDKQMKSIVSFPLYLAGNAYLRTMSDIMDCADTLGLETFLESPHERVLQMIVTRDFEFEAARLYNILIRIRNRLLNKKYLEENYHTILNWNDIQNYKVVDFKELMTKDITNNNLLILNFPDKLPIPPNHELMGTILMNLTLFNYKKLVIIRSQPIDANLFEQYGLNVETKPLEAFQLSDLTSDSRKQILARDVMALGEETMSLGRLLGNNSNTTNEQLDNLLNQSTSIILKNLATNNWSVEKIPNNLSRLCEMDAFYSKGNKLVDKARLTALLESSGSGGPLLVVGDPNQLSQDYWGKVAEVERRRIFTTEEDGQDLFQEKCRQEPERIIYWFQLSAEGFSLNEIYNKSVYIDRKFHSRVIIKFINDFVRYNGSKDLFIFKNATDKKELISHFDLSREEERIFVSKDHFKVDSEDIIIEDSFSKHYFELDCTGEGPCLVWQCSKGSLDGLRPFIEIDYSNSTEEENFCRTRKELVIIADDPGMGKTTSLTRMSEFIQDSWVLRIDHKLLDSATAKLPPKLTLQSVTNCLIHASGLPTNNDLFRNILQHCLETEKSGQICVLVDAFDEITDEETKVKTVGFLKYLKTATRCQTVITTRLHTQEWLENDLAEFAAELKKITEDEQEVYLVKSWLPHLALEHTEHGESEEKTLRKFARELRKEVERMLGKDVSSFMGIPLQIRMLAEVFLQQAIQSVVSPEQENKLPKITNLFVLYKQFINVKETIFYGQKTKISKLPPTFQIAMKEYVMKKHYVLAFMAIDPTFATEYFRSVKFSNQELKDISCLGLIQSKTEDTFSFIHGTFQEYFCADFFVRWLKQKRKSNEKNTLIIKELSKFLLRTDYRTIRMFIETQLEIIHKSGDALENHPVIYQHWSKDRQLLCNDNKKTALHIAAEEQNLHTFAVLLGGPDSRISDQAYISFIAARDKTGKTALNIGLENRNTNMVNKLIDNVNSCSYESLLEIMLATFLDMGGNKNNGDRNSDSDIFSDSESKSDSDSDSDSDRDRNSDGHNGNNDGNKINKSEVIYTKECFPNTPQMTNVNKAFNQVQQIRNANLKPFIAAVRKNQNDVVLKILRNMKNDTERFYLLIAIDSRGNTAINLATCKPDHILFKEFAKQGVCVSYDKDGQNPLHCAADQGYIRIVNYLLNQTEETYKNINSMYEYNGDEEIILKQFSSINSQDKGGKTALMLAARGGHNDVVRKLLDSGADINSADNEGFTAVMLAAENNHPETVNILVDSREYINSVNKYGNTALMLAAMKESRKAMRALLEKEANINSANNDGDTALMYAAQRGYHRVVSILLKANADTKNQIIGGETALSRAISYGHLKVVKLLLKYNPKILSQDNSWKSALSKAEKSGHKEIVDLIRNH